MTYHHSKHETCIVMDGTCMYNCPTFFLFWKCLDDMSYWTNLYRTVADNELHFFTISNLNYTVFVSLAHIILLRLWLVLIHVELRNCPVPGTKKFGPLPPVSSLSRLNKTILAHYSRFNKIATLGYIMAHEGMGTDHYSMS